MDRILSVRNRILKDSDLNSEYMVYITMASVIAAIGLITDSAATLIASMVISPIMNHVLAFTFGTFLNDHRLIQRGLSGVFLSVGICIVTGILASLICYDTLVLTPEMLQRTEWENLWWSLFVAAASGIATASSLVHSHRENLVGIAISTSMLPPAVNFGLLLPQALKHPEDHVQVIETAVSLLLTISNIILIFISVNLMLLLYANTICEKNHWVSTIPSVRRLDLLEENPASTV